jgi:2-hydroxy-6-oxonona-2,4-dienedioate hydrolase
MTPEEHIKAIEAKAQIRTSPCGDGEMVWHVWGEGEPLVLLHGGFGSWMHWVNNIEFFAEHFQVICPDIPCHGDSAEAPQPHDAPNISKILSDGLDIVAPGPAKLRLCGFSFGGIMAGNVSAWQGERVHSLIVVGSNGLDCQRGEVKGLQDWRKAETEVERLACHRRNLEVIMFGDPTKIDDVAICLQDMNTRRSRMKSRKIAYTPALLTALPKLKGTLYGIWGEKDVYAELYMKERQDIFESMQPGCEFQVIAGAGHWAPYEAPEQFNPMALEMVKG